MSDKLPRREFIKRFFLVGSGALGITTGRTRTASASADSQQNWLVIQIGQVKVLGTNDFNGFADFRFIALVHSASGYYFPGIAYPWVGP